MRRDCSHLFPLISILFLFSTLSFGQPWSGIISPSRAIDWSHAGLPASYPNGDTTPNGWTPPDAGWAQCGSTLSPIGGGADDTTQINNALAACAANHYVLLGPGTFSIQNQLNQSIVTSAARQRADADHLKRKRLRDGSHWAKGGQAATARRRAACQQGLHQSPLLARQPRQ